MKVQLKRLSILRTGNFVASFYALIMLLMVPMVLIGIVADPTHDTLPIARMIRLLVVYPVTGFVAGCVAAAFYNFITKIIGGLILEMEVEPVQGQSKGVNQEKIKIQGQEP